MSMLVNYAFENIKHNVKAEKHLESEAGKDYNILNMNMVLKIMFFSNRKNLYSADVYLSLNF